MKILDYEGLKQVVSKIKGLIDKKADKVDLEDKTKFFDTRDKSENPDWYIKNKAQSTFRELKKSQDINLEEGEEADYWLLITMFGWSDTSAGYPMQISLSSTRPEAYFRIGVSNSEWSEWKRLLNDEDLRLSLSDMADDSTHRLVTDAEKTKWNNKAEKSYVDSSIASVNKEINSIENRISSSLESRLKQLESALYEDITGNPFTITFNDINGLSLTNGIFNQSKARIEC